LNRVRTELSANTTTIRSLNRIFQVIDSDNSRMIDKQELYWGLRDLGCKITKREAGLLLDYLDTSKDGLVDYQEFLVGIRGRPNEERCKVIDQAYNKFDVYGEGSIYATELAGTFSCDRHPEVLAGTMTVNDVFVKFLSTFGNKHANGAITRQEWQDHYSAVSA
jgi:calcyphosin